MGWVVFLVEAVVVNERRMTDLEQGCRLEIGVRQATATVPVVCGIYRSYLAQCRRAMQAGRRVCQWSIEDAAQQEEDDDGEGDSVSEMTEGIDVDNCQLVRTRCKMLQRCTTSFFSEPTHRPVKADRDGWTMSG